MPYYVEHYPADGCSEPDPQRIGPFDTIGEAQDAVADVIPGGGSFGSWEPPEEADGIEGWHESAKEGCGGWMIYRA